MGKSSFCKSASIVDLNLYKNILIEMISKFSHIHYDPKKEKCFIYGGKNLPQNCIEFENENNQNIIKEYLPKFRELVKGETNWFQKNNSPHIATTYLKYFLKILTQNKLESKVARYKSCNSYMINKFYLPTITF